MILPVVQFGHPALRQKGAPIAEITPAIQELIADMFETMHAACGIGLAAQQVARPMQLAVVDVREIKDRPSTLEWEGQLVEVADHMPLVLINPQLQPSAELVPAPEGCLSFPEIFEEITRPASVEVIALNANGKAIRFKAGGLLARVIQHETDHLNGILFIDRMAAATKRALKPELDHLQQTTKETLAKSGSKP